MPQLVKFSYKQKFKDRDVAFFFSGEMNQVAILEGNLTFFPLAGAIPLNFLLLENSQLETDL